VLVKPLAGFYTAGAPAGAVEHHAALGKRLFLRFLLLGPDFGRNPRVKLGQFSKQHFVIWLFINIMNIDIPDDTPLVNDKNGPLRIPHIPQHAVTLGDLPVRPKITQ